jgi:hypothetical protein
LNFKLIAAPFTGFVLRVKRQIFEDVWPQIIFQLSATRGSFCQKPMRGENYWSEEFLSRLGREFRKRTCINISTCGTYHHLPLLCCILHISVSSGSCHPMTLCS